MKRSPWTAIRLHTIEAVVDRLVIYLGDDPEEKKAQSRPA